MKVVFIAPRFHTNQFHLTKGLMENGYEVYFLANETKYSENHSHIRPIIVGYSFLARLLKDEKFKQMLLPPTLTCIKELIKIKPDIVITREFSMQSYLISLICRIYSIKCILYTQKAIFEKKRRTIDIYRTLFPKTVMSPVRGYKINETNPTKKNGKDWYYVPFVCPLNPESRYRTYFKQNRINILVVAKFTARKKIYEIIEAYSGLLERYNNLHLVVIGTVLDKYYFQSILDYITRHNLNDYIEILKDIPNEQMNRYYQDNDIFILPSINESASYSQLEAMANGMAVICTDDNGTSDYIYNNDNGYIIDSKRLIEDIIEKLELLINDKSKISSMGKRSMELIKKNHTIKNYLNFIENL